jgi:putative ABC transport system ATP-binding protein
VTTGEPAIVLDRLSKTYGEGAIAVHALREVSLTLAPGELVVLLGPSGSGKTTLLNIVGGIESPTSGRVVAGGVEVTGLSQEGRTRYRREHVGFVFQFFNLVPTLTALENVQLIAELRPSSEPSLDRAQRALESVALADQVNRFPGQLSGGQQQRVAIARALVNEPSILLCDEPTGSLDLETGRQVLGLLRRASREQGHTVLLVTHNSAIAEMADRVVRMRSGEIADDERVSEPIAAERVAW